MGFCSPPPFPYFPESGLLSGARTRRIQASGLDQPNAVPEDFHEQCGEAGCEHLSDHWLKEGTWPWAGPNPWLVLERAGPPEGVSLRQAASSIAAGMSITNKSNPLVTISISSKWRSRPGSPPIISDPSELALHRAKSHSNTASPPPTSGPTSRQAPSSKAVVSLTISSKACSQDVHHTFFEKMKKPTLCLLHCRTKLQSQASKPRPEKQNRHLSELVEGRGRVGGGRVRGYDVLLARFDPRAK